MGGCLSSKLIITRSLSQHTHTTILPNNNSNSNSNSNNNPHPPPSTSTHHLLALLRAVNNLPKPPPPPAAHQPCIREDDPPSPLDHNSYGDKPFNRSFHTVEEYDALLETHHHSLQNSHDNNVISSQLQNSRLTDSDTLEVSMMRESNSKVEEEEEEAQQHGGGGGSKWKRVGKGLGLLQLPPTVTTLTLGGQVYSPGLGLGGSNYVTPKFGSYNVHVHVHVPPPLPTRLEEEDDNSNTNIIDPDLVAAFDECMLQLQLEQDNLIKQIDEGDHPF